MYWVSRVSATYAAPEYPFGWEVRRNKLVADHHSVFVVIQRVQRRQRFDNCVPFHGLYPLLFNPGPLCNKPLGPGDLGCGRQLVYFALGVEIKFVLHGPGEVGWSVMLAQRVISTYEELT